MFVVGIRVLTVLLGVSGVMRACLRTGDPCVGLNKVGDGLCSEDVCASPDLDRFIGVSCVSSAGGDGRDAACGGRRNIKLGVSLIALGGSLAEEGSTMGLLLWREGMGDMGSGVGGSGLCRGVEKVGRVWVIGGRYTWRWEKPGEVRGCLD